VIVAFVELLTAVVVIVKVVEVAPPATITVAGTVATAFPLTSETTAPPGGAAWSNVIVPVEFVPPTTVVGFNLIATPCTL